MATSISSKKFNWVRSPSAWESAEAWRNKRAEMAAKFREMNETAANSFASAQYDNLSGSVSNAQQAAIDRLKKSV
jgi:hypothetical protein